MHSEKVHEAKYLGVTLTEEGVSEFENGGKDQKSEKRSRCTEKARVFTNGVHPSDGQSDYISP